MADKEERIYICKTFKTDPCEICEGSGQIECAICRKKYMFDKSISRSEAVERMAKAACKANRRCIGGVCETCTSDMPKGYIHSSEAEMDALLGGKK